MLASLLQMSSGNRKGHRRRWGRRGGTRRPRTKWECSYFSLVVSNGRPARPPHKGLLSLTRRLFFLRVEWPGFHPADQEA